jgi:hypothetical protein
MVAPMDNGQTMNSDTTSPSADEEDGRERRGTYAPGNRLMGRVIGCSGSKATVSAFAGKDGNGLAELWSVGRLISISVGENRVVALVCSMSTAVSAWSETDDNVMHIDVELVGEIRTGVSGKSEFSAGITQYPYLGAVVHRMRSSDLEVIYDPGVNDTAVIGKLTQDTIAGSTHSCAFPAVAAFRGGRHNGRRQDHRRDASAAQGAEGRSVAQGSHS